MSPEAIGMIGVGVVIALMFFRMWIGLSMIVVSFLGIAYLKDMDAAFGVLRTVPYSNVAFYPISAIPLYVFMAVIITNTGIGASLFKTAHTWLGQLRGGLAMASVMACGGLAAIMGDSVAEVVTMSKIAVPEMRKYKYDEQLASGCIAAGGTLGILIPPSLGFIMYGILTEQSIGALFMAGILPGILLVLLFILTVAIIVALRPGAGPAGPRTNLAEKIASLKGTWHTVILFALIIGGIYAGVFTPTEAGAVGAFGAIVISTVSKRLTFKSLGDALAEATRVTAMMVLIIIGGFVMMKFLAISKLPFALAGMINDLALPRYGVFAAIIVLYILLGMFLPVFAAVVLTIPVIFPVVVNLGFDPIWFGVIIVLILEMGLVTPPVGMNVFVLSGMTNIPLDTVFRGIIPFVVAMIVCLVLITIFPQIALFLPGLMQG